MRFAIFGVGAAATAMALSVGSIYVLFHLCSDLVFVILFPQLCCVIYFKASNTYGSIAGYIFGLFLRVGGGEDKIGFHPFIKYPFYDEVKGQLFPFRTLSMTVSFSTIVSVSFLAKYLFEREIIPLKYDFLHAFMKHEIQEEKEKYMEESKMWFSFMGRFLTEVTDADWYGWCNLSCYTYTWVKHSLSSLKFCFVECRSFLHFDFHILSEYHFVND